MKVQGLYIYHDNGRQIGGEEFRKKHKVFAFVYCLTCGHRDFTMNEVIFLYMN